MKRDRRGRAYDEELLRRGALRAWRVEEPVPFCWMCDRSSGRRAKEHIFPRWLLRELDATKLAFAPIHGDPLGRPISRRGPISADNFVAGEVCEECNAGWMSQLEVAARPILLQAERRGTLTVADQAVLARWFVKTAVVLNTSQNYRLMIPASARHALADRIPLSFGVWLGRRSAVSPLSFFQTTGAMGVAPSDRVAQYQAAAERVYGCGLGVADLVGVVVFAEPGGWARPYDPMVRIWSPRATVPWEAVPEVEERVDSLFLVGEHPEFSRPMDDPVDRAIRAIESRGEPGDADPNSTGPSSTHLK